MFRLLASHCLPSFHGGNAINVVKRTIANDTLPRYIPSPLSTFARGGGHTDRHHSAAHFPTYNSPASSYGGHSGGSLKSPVLNTVKPGAVFWMNESSKNGRDSQTDYLGSSLTMVCHSNVVSGFRFPRSLLICNSTPIGINTI